MQYISSDTNIWIDFNQIDRLSMPFRLECIYCMSADAIEEELLEPPEIREQLLRWGLRPIEIDETEFRLVYEWNAVYKKLSFYDLMALAIAKRRGFILLTGDGALRRAALQEGVEVHGTLWVLDRLIETQKITIEEYHAALIDIRDDDSGMIRLPREEIIKRIARKE